MICRGLHPSDRSLLLSWLRTCLACVACLACLCAAARDAKQTSQADALREKAEQGDLKSQVDLGILLFRASNGRDPQADAEALAWFRKAAERNDARAQDFLGILYSQGRGVARDYVASAQWFRLAAEQGQEHAQRELAQMYAQGLGVPKDREESRRWSERVAARQPHRVADLLRLWFLAVVLVLVGFAVALRALQRRTLQGNGRLLALAFVHVVGIALVLNTIDTYGFEFAFPECAHGFLATSCSQYADPRTRAVAQALGDWQVLNLLARFMAGVGLVLDALAIWYLVFLVGPFLPGRRARAG